MGDVSKLKVAIGQPELVCGRLSANDEARERMVGHAVDAGADLLVMPGSLEDPHDVHLIVLNDSRIDVAGNAVHLEACGETYRIGLDPGDTACDFSVLCDVAPWTLSGFDAVKAVPGVPTVVLRPVGMRNADKDVLAYDGGTCAYDGEGTLVASLRDDFEEDIAKTSCLLRSLRRCAVSTGRCFRGARNGLSDCQEALTAASWPCC